MHISVQGGKENKVGVFVRVFGAGYSQPVIGRVYPTKHGPLHPPVFSVCVRALLACYQ